MNFCFKFLEECFIPFPNSSKLVGLSSPPFSVFEKSDETLFLVFDITRQEIMTLKQFVFERSIDRVVAVS